MDKLKAIVLSLSLVNKASNKIAEAKHEAKEEGFAAGKHEKAVETAKNFLKMGLSIEQVASGTGLSIEEIRELM